MAELQPLILVNPVLTINGVPLECLMSHVELTPDVETIEVKTSCGVKEYPGTVKWTLNATLYHSHDPAGTNATLDAAVAGGEPVPFTVVPSSDPVSATNPQYVGELIPRPYSPINGDVGDASSVDLEWSIQGWGNVPTQNESTTTATGATAGSPGTWTPPGSTPPASLAAASSVVASPATAWTTGQHVVTGDAASIHWDGAAWATGAAAVTAAKAKADA